MNPGLFRLLLASIVVVQHFSRLAIGTMAVYVFFMLSGYWVSRMWRTKYALMETPYRSFILSRFARLMPTFLLVSSAMILMHWYTDSMLELSKWERISTWALLGYASIPGGGYLIPAWSLDIEMQFYAIAPVLLWAMSRLRRPWLVLALTLPMAVILVTNPKGNFPIVAPYLLFFSIGMVACVLHWRPSTKLAMLSATAFGFTLLLAVVFPLTRSLVFVGAHPGPLSNYNGAFCVLLAATAAPFALATVWRRSLERDRNFGDISYVLYLVHFPFAWWANYYYLEHPTFPRLTLVAMSIGLAFVASALVWRYFDSPIAKWRQRMLSRERVAEQVIA